MTSEEGYNQMVVFLGKYFMRTKLHDLAPLLGSMDPSLGTTNKPIDSCMTRDWYEITSGNDLTEAQCWDAIREFVKVQQTEFKYDLKKLIKDMDRFSDKSMKKDWEETLRK